MNPTSFYSPALKFVQTIILLTLLLIYATPALSFYSHGSINAQLSYQNIEVFPTSSKHYMKVRGYIKNNSKHECYLSAYIQFCNIHKTIINSARIVENIKSGQTLSFESFLKKGENYRDTKGAHHINWDIRSFREKKPLKIQKKPASKNTDYQPRANYKKDSYIQESTTQPSYNPPAENNNVAVVLKNGRRINAISYQDRGDSIKVFISGGSVSFQKESIEKIE